MAHWRPLSPGRDSVPPVYSIYFTLLKGGGKVSNEILIKNGESTDAQGVENSNGLKREENGDRW